MHKKLSISRRAVLVAILPYIVFPSFYRMHFKNIHINMFLIGERKEKTEVNLAPLFHKLVSIYKLQST